MNESFSLRDHGGHAALGASLAATLGTFLPADAWAQEAGPTTLPQISVESAGGSPANTNLTPIGTSRLPGTVQDTPQTINVVPREILEQQNVTTLEQALRNVPGVTVSVGEGNGGLNGDQFRVRGFQAKNDLFVDGLRDFGVYQRDSFNTESVQVLKGPSSEAFGVGTVGGAINQVSKRSFLGNVINIDGSFGTGFLGRGTFDVNRQIDATTAIRLNGMVNQQDIADRNNVKSDRWGIAASLGFGLGTDTQWHLNYFHQYTDRTPDMGVPTIQAPGWRYAIPATEFGLPRQTSYVRSTDRDKSSTDLLTSLMKWQVNDWLTVTSDTRLAFYDRNFSQTNPAGCTAACATNFLAGGNPVIGYGAGGGMSFLQNDWGVENVTAGTAKFTTGPFRHEAVFGVNYFYQDSERQSLTAVGGRLPQNIRTPAFANASTFIRNPAGRRLSDSEDIGLFAQDRVWIVDQLSILGGIRWDSFSSTLRTSNAAGLLGPTTSNNNEFVSPKVSVILEPTKDQTFYMTYAQATSPTGQYAASATGIELPSTFLPPERSELYEVGAKINVLDGKLGLFGSIFRVNKDGSFDVDPVTGVAVAGPLDAGESRRVHGVEIGASGNITEEWNVQLAYARLDGRVVRTNTGTNVGNVAPYVADDNFSVFTTYNIAPHLAIPGKLLVGGGVFYQSEYFADSGNVTRVPASLSVDSLISYEVNNIRIALNGYNLTDELNYGAAFNGRVTPASGRTFVGSFGVRF
ncbi:TonB-dependent receptor [Enterovirga aerilata]|uniref:TonB-dependent receptor n=1 Tax=Enterovirga aerilata TaxID=2730920 RepID=A0A849I980_9HYPH|nr:TonB-dependent receptor [Enterovirga sp. DB1703]NNM74364.1 TonB-dependent receptor [Enterovirga sp. DB1703]